MATSIEDVETHFLNLNATSEICTNFGTTFTSNSNLFLQVEPASPINCVTLIAEPGAPPDTKHKGAQYPKLLVRVQSNTVVKAYKVTQSIINTLHLNDEVGSNIKMKLFCENSAPLFVRYDADDYPVFGCGFDSMIIKYTVS